MFPIKVICSWCNEEIGVKEGGEREGLVSHGICPKCHDEQMEKIREMKERQEKKDIEEKPTEPKFPMR